MKKCRRNLDIIQMIVPLKAAADKVNKPKVSSLSHLTAVLLFETALTGPGLNIIGQATDYIYS